MRYCLCCGKEIRESDKGFHRAWHEKCIRAFFGTGTLPEIELNNELLERLARETVKSGLTVPGVQKKLSLHLLSGETERLTLVNYPSGYILKPQTTEYEALPEAEQTVMLMANEIGIATVPHALIRFDNDEYGYITKRIDRRTDKSSHTELLAMEDFCQLDGRLTEDKYKGSYERCAKLIAQYSSRKGFDLSELFLRLVFSYLTGNSDMHLKNFALIETEPGNRTFVLSPAYDLLPVNCILPEDGDAFALTMQGKKSNLKRTDFVRFAESCGLESRTAERMIDSTVNKRNKMLDVVEKSLMSDERKEALKELLEKRAERIG